MNDNTMLALASIFGTPTKKYTDQVKKCNDPEYLEKKVNEIKKAVCIKQLEEKITEFLTDYEYIFFDSYAGIDDFKNEIINHVTGNYIEYFSETLDIYRMNTENTKKEILIAAVNAWIDHNRENIMEQLELMEDNV